MAEPGEDGTTVGVGWPDNIGAIDVDVAAAYARYLRRPDTLDTVIDKLCETTDRKMSKHRPRGWDS